MSIKARGTIAVLAGCVAAAAGVTPAAASGQVPIDVPLGGVESALHVDAPHLSTAAPIPIPGTPEGPRYTRGHVLPQGMVPRLPVGSELPATEADVPVPQLLASKDVDRLGLEAEASDVRAVTPGAEVNPPLSGPQPNRLGLPKVSAPRAGLASPDLQARPGAELALG
ncbi:hypothetical protein GTY65_06825 [Streptomyces sp. SID8379]|uniref:hypothetical protein n=1 Tax=unclassified Streptomyces TaxID=2593676 RepID=UPI0004781105|nr:MULTISPECIES: hypothetical protein [unclassified Streptomyces]MYW63794.1 hypothetical protein [Streptomyces sp. SID8379]